MFISAELFQLGGLADVGEMIFTHVQMEFSISLQKVCYVVGKTLFFWSRSF